MGEEPGPGAVRSSSLTLLALGVALIAAYFVLAATTTIGDPGDIGGGLILLICGGTPGQPGPFFTFSSVGLKWCRSAAAVKVERPWTNDLDRGEDRRMLLAAEEDEGQVRSGAAPDSACWPQEWGIGVGCAGARPYLGARSS
jgi:hypothetical protein